MSTKKTKSRSATSNNMHTIKFIGYHYGGSLSEEYVISEEVAEYGGVVNIPIYDGDGEFEFRRWDTDFDGLVTGDLTIHALCKPSWDLLLSLTDDEIHTLINDDDFNDGEFIKLFPDESFRNEIENSTRLYIKQDYPKVGKSYEQRKRSCELTPFNPEGGLEYDEAAANSIINVKNLEITFKPKRFVDETKKFVQEKVMPYLTTMIPSTTIFSYKFYGEEDDVVLKTPKIVYYEADDDNLSSDNKVVISNDGSMEIEFDAIVSDAKTYHIKVDSSPADYTVNLRIEGTPGDWISVKRDKNGDGFLIKAIKDNYSTLGDTTQRSLTIKGTIETVSDDEYDGTAVSNVNIICKQNAYVYDRVEEIIPVSIVGKQNESKTQWLVTWESTNSIEAGKYKVKFCDSKGGIIDEKEISGLSGDFYLESSDDILTMSDVYNKKWEKFTTSAYTVYEQEGTLQTETSDDIFKIVSVENDILEYNENSNKFVISANTSWSVTAWRVDDPTIKQEFTGASCGEYTIDTILAGENLSESNYQYMISGSTTSKSITDVASFEKKYKVAFNFAYTLSPSTGLTCNGGSMKVTIDETDGKAGIRDIELVLSCGTYEDVYKEFSVNTSTKPHIFTVPKNTDSISKDWEISVHVVDISGLSHDKTLTFSQEPLSVELYYGNDKKKTITVSSGATSLSLTAKSKCGMSFVKTTGEGLTLSPITSNGDTGVTVTLNANDNTTDRSWDISAKSSLNELIKDTVSITQHGNTGDTTTLNVRVKCEPKVEISERCNVTIKLFKDGIQVGDDVNIDGFYEDRTYVAEFGNIVLFSGVTYTVSATTIQAWGEAAEPSVEYNINGDGNSFTYSGNCSGGITVPWDGDTDITIKFSEVSGGGTSGGGSDTQQNSPKMLSYTIINNGDEGKGESIQGSTSVTNYTNESSYVSFNVPIPSTIAGEGAKFTCTSSDAIFYGTNDTSIERSVLNGVVSIDIAISGSNVEVFLVTLELNG